VQLFPTRQVFLEIGPLAIHWYGIMYLLAFLLAWWIVPRIAPLRGLFLSADETSQLLLYTILGTLLGGRLGYVILYGAGYYAAHPLEILAVWKGGMSSHGGLLGVMFAGWFFVRRQQVSFWQLADIAVIPAALGLALGRMGNFINLELYGPVTNLPWGIEIPGVEGLRHPTQLYAVAKNLIIAGICFRALKRAWGKPGMIFGLFLVLYGILRFLVEFVRVETATGVDFGLVHLTRGQVLTIPVLLAGLLILWERNRTRKS
jgi:phosphatidylglycerol---prolipoprotein diacylglyceryl transferase